MFGFASRPRLSEVRHYEARACVLRRRARTNSKLKPTTTRHDSPVLIFDELVLRTFYCKPPVAQRPIENSTAPPPCNACNHERACNLSAVLRQAVRALLTLPSDYIEFACGL